MSLKRGMSRRRFLGTAAQTTAAALSFPYIIPASALGLDGHVAPSNRVTLASIGTGGQGTYDTRALLNLDEVQYIGVCDVDRKHCAAAKQMIDEHYTQKSGKPYQSTEQFYDFREVLARGDIDAVMVATPDFWHGVISVAAAKAGKDIYCEKPLANSIPESRAVVDAVRRYRRVLQTGSHERSRDNARYACELVRNGRIGKLHTIRVNMPVDNHGPIGPQPEMPVPEGFDYQFWLGPAPDAPYTEKRCHFWFRYILDYSGGEMTDRGAHIIDLGQLGNGTDDTGPVSVWGEGMFPKEGLFNSAMSYKFGFEYANGVKMLGESIGPRGVRFEGEDGWIFIHIHGGDLEASSPSLLQEKIGPDELHLGRSRGHHQDFVQAVLTRGEPKAPVEVGHHTATMCHLANVAMRLGRKLNWNPETEQFLNDDEANRMLIPNLRSPWHV
ncbi:MAG: Gfo/Idh/MocA family oxidoreductase [Candidatus Hydrogenedentes bacterium]|nr:Gfo/Idh/MocA family oxidoreductase [Candidatus Hydrogenedentota bacterium]